MPPPSAPVLVTGGCGFIGRPVCRALGEAGRAYRILDLAEAADHRIDLTDPAGIDALFDATPFSGIIHLAGLLNTASRRDPAAAARVNVGGSLTVFEAARRHGIPRIVYGSSLSVYGGVAPADPAAGISETDPVAPADVYGASKRYVELAGEAFESAGAFGFFSLRIGNVLGPGARNTASPWRSDLFEKMGTGATVAVPYAPDAALALLHVDDVAAMLVRLLDAPADAPHVVNAPAETWTMRGLADAVTALDAGVGVTLGTAPGLGPARVDGRRFAAAFPDLRPSLRARLATAAGG